MLDLTLKRFYTTVEGTIGGIYNQGRLVCYTIEPEWLDNQSNVSCIPAATYHAAHLERSASGHYRDVWHIRDVPSREGILIHAGNYAGRRPEAKSDTYGCILPASKFGLLPGRPGKGKQLAGLNSRGALLKLRTLIGHNDFTLTVDASTMKRGRVVK